MRRIHAYRQIINPPMVVLKIVPYFFNQFGIYENPNIAQNFCEFFFDALANQFLLVIVSQLSSRSQRGTL